MSPPCLVYVVTDPITALRFLDGQLGFMREHGFAVSLIASPGESLNACGARERVETIGLPMERGMDPLGDLRSLARLTGVLRRLAPDLVVASTPKAGLLGTMAARAAGVPNIVYHLRGLRFETATGPRRTLLLGTERIASLCAHRIQCNGESLRREFVASGCAPSSKVWVPGSGTSNGVNVARYSRTEERRTWARTERARLGIAPDAYVVGFVGRMARDKGVAELFSAHRAVVESMPGTRLLVVGGDEPTDPLPEELRAALANDPSVVRLGHVREPEPYYSLMDVLAFPSYREGFPNAPLEAASASVPTAGFAATGTVDAVVDGETGTLVRLKDAEALAGALIRYGKQPELRESHGSAARERALARFDQVKLWKALADDYQSLIDSGRHRG